MALKVEPLTSAILQLILQPPASPDIAARMLGEIYHAYAQDAKAGALSPILSDLNKGLLTVALTAALKMQPGSLATYALGLQGLMGYWMTPPVLFGAFPVVVPPSPLIVPTLMSGLLDKSATPDIAAKTLATALHVATKSMIVVVIPSGPTPVT